MLDTLRVNSDSGENQKKSLKPPTRKPTQTLRNLSQLDVRAELNVRAHAVIWSLVSFRSLSQERILALQNGCFEETHVLPQNENLRSQIGKVSRVEIP